MNGDPLSDWDRRIGAAPRQADVILPPPEHDAALQWKPERMYAFLADRGISAETVDSFGVYVFRHTFAGNVEPAPSIVFPYTVEKRLVNRAYRHPAGVAIEYEDAALPSLFNVDAVDAADPQVIWWVQREIDALALHEAGYPQVVCLPQIAAPAPSAVDPLATEDDRRFLPLRTHDDLLAKAKRIILAVDADAYGVELREELARRLGRHRCWTAQWPEGCKDAGDTLKQHGRAVVQACIEQAKPYPIEGIQRVEIGTLAKLRAQPSPKVLTTGISSLDKVLKLPGEGRLIVLLGLATHGKSSLLRFLMVHTAQEHQRRWMIFSPELQPWAQFAATIAEVYIGDPFWPSKSHRGMTPEAVALAEAWMSDRITFLSSDAEDEAPTLDWIFEKARISLLRDGITDLAIDPWNEVAHDRAGAFSEHEYIGRALQKLKAFGLRHGVNIWIVVHPTKLPPAKPGGEIPPPGMYDAAGSSHFANKADVVLTIHTPPSSDTEVHVRKVRFQRWGERGKMAKIEFDRTNGRYYAPAGTLFEGEAP